MFICCLIQVVMPGIIQWLCVTNLNVSVCKGPIQWSNVLVLVLQVFYM